MNVEIIREKVKVRPFKAFEIHLDNGEVHKVNNPEIIVTEEFIATVDENGKLVLIAPEAVSSIKVV